MLKPKAGAWLTCAVCLLWIAAGTRPLTAQTVTRDEPLSYSAVEEPKPEPATGAKAVLEAISWYIPNRLMDITDIPRVHISAGDGMGATLRFTKWVWWSSWFEDDAYCLGWTKRTAPFWGESIHERYFGFLAAHEGELDRDPTEVGFSFHFIAIGANLAVSVGETADALLGFVGIDLSNDDHGPVMFDMAPPEKEDKPAEQ